MTTSVNGYYGMVERLKGGLPWYVKIGAKLCLSRLPIPYSIWRQVGLYRHGYMDMPRLALKEIRAIIEQAGYGSRLDGLSVLELGPGDSLSTALIAHALGARETVLLDTGTFAVREVQPYVGLVDLLAHQNNAMSALKRVRDTDALLQATGARYLTEGLTSLQSLPAGSIDFAFSKAVLEHIRLAEFRPMMRALREKLAPGGRCYHFVDLQDHLDHALNNLRFSDKVWESDWMAKSGFYTNRIGCSEMLAAFEDAGFAVQELNMSKFEQMPTPRARMAKRFEARSEQDLLVSGFSVLLRPA